MILRDHLRFRKMEKRVRQERKFGDRPETVRRPIGHASRAHAAVDYR